MKTIILAVSVFASAQPIFNVHAEEWRTQLVGREMAVVYSAERITSQNMAEFIDKEITVEGDALRIHPNMKNTMVIIDFHLPWRGYLSAIIPGGALSKFDNPYAMYENKRIRATGVIIEGRGRPEMLIFEPSQIEIIGESTTPEDPNFSGHRHDQD